MSAAGGAEFPTGEGHAVYFSKVSVGVEEAWLWRQQEEGPGLGWVFENPEDL